MQNDDFREEDCLLCTSSVLPVPQQTSLMSHWANRLNPGLFCVNVKQLKKINKKEAHLTWPCVPTSPRTAQWCCHQWRFCLFQAHSSSTKTSAYADHNQTSLLGVFWLFGELPSPGRQQMKQTKNRKFRIILLKGAALTHCLIILPRWSVYWSVTDRN